jgi:hypothetical protein
MNDYVDAAERHYLSAKALDEHPATASHCYGISAECVLKALMSNLQPQASAISKAHLQNLWSAFAVSPALSAYPNRVTMAMNFQTFFAQWDINQRYFNRSHSTLDLSKVNSQKQGAEGLWGLLQQVQQGLI